MLAHQTRTTTHPPPPKRRQGDALYGVTHSTFAGPSTEQVVALLTTSKAAQRRATLYPELERRQRHENELFYTDLVPSQPGPVPPPFPCCCLWCCCV